MAPKDTLTLKDAKRAEAAGWFAMVEWHREYGPAIRPSKPTGHQLLTEAAEAMRKGEWNPADGPYQPKAHDEWYTSGVKAAAAAAAARTTKAKATTPKTADRGDER
jgi:hypothetical protein